MGRSYLHCSVCKFIVRCEKMIVELDDSCVGVTDLTIRIVLNYSSSTLVTVEKTPFEVLR